MFRQLVFTIAGTLLLTAMLTPVCKGSIYSDYVESTNPVIYWGLDEAFADYSPGNNAADAAPISGGDNQGQGAVQVVSTYPLAGAEGIVDGAAGFTKGTASYQGKHCIEYGQLNSTAAVPVDDYSIQLWVKSTRQVMTSGGTDDRLHYFFSRTHDSNPTMAYNVNTWQRPDLVSLSGYQQSFPRLAYASMDGDGANAETDDSPTTTPTDLTNTWDEWHQVVFTRATDGYVSVYLDGQLEIYQYDPLDTNYPQYAGDYFMIGNRPDYRGNGWFGFTGLIDEVAVWDTALSASQVSGLYSTLVPEPSSLALFVLAGFCLPAVRRRRRK